MSLIPTFIADAYVHDLNPVLLPISGAFAIRWYGLSYLAGFIVAFVLLKWMAKTARVAIPAEKVFDLIIYGVAGVLIGGRLGFVIFYDLPMALSAGETPLLWEFTSHAPFWGALALNDGGMASHGGIIGVMLAMWMFAARNKISWPHVMDCVALICAPGLGLGRIANFINGELWGKRLPDDMQGQAAPWWGVQYPEEILDFARDTPDTPTAELIRATDIPQQIGVSIADWERHIAGYRVSGESADMVHRWVDRIIEQVREGNQQVIDALQPLLTVFYPSQLIQAAAEGVVLFMVLAIIWLRPVRPGMIGTSLLAAYGVMRIATEVVRQPDEGVAIIFGLQRGQLLSGLMLLGFVVALTYVLWRKQSWLGGLLKPSAETRAMQDRAREATAKPG